MTKADGPHRETALQFIRDSELPGIVLKIFQGSKDIGSLSYYCQDPYYSFQPHSNLPDGFTPLWECGIVITGFNQKTQLYQKINLEAPSPPTFEYSKFESVVANLLIDLWELETEVTELERVSREFHYPHLSTLLEALESDQPEDYSEFLKWRHQLCEKGSHP